VWRFVRRPKTSIRARVKASGSFPKASAKLRRRGWMSSMFKRRGVIVNWTIKERKGFSTIKLFWK
jgi:hypothetical protein